MITDDQLRAAICCPHGCRDPDRCDRHRKEVREAAKAVGELMRASVPRWVVPEGITKEDLIKPLGGYVVSRSGSLIGMLEGAAPATTRAGGEED